MTPQSLEDKHDSEQGQTVSSLQTLNRQDLGLDFHKAHFLSSYLLACLAM